MAAALRISALQQAHKALPARIWSAGNVSINSSLVRTKWSQNPRTILQLSKSRWNSVQQNLPAFSRVATLHTSPKRDILPPLPQRIDGTANDPASVPDPSPTHGSYHWTFERLMSAALIPLTVAPFAAGSLNPLMDATLCATILIHSYIGFQSIIIDYIPTKRLPKTRVLFWWSLRAATAFVGVGLYEFETNDIGVTATIHKIWKA